MTPTHRLKRTTLIGFAPGALVAGASGYGLAGVIVIGLIVGIASALAMLGVLAIEAADRRAHHPVVREPMSHVEPIEPTRARQR